MPRKYFRTRVCPRLPDMCLRIYFEFLLRGYPSMPDRSRFLNVPPRKPKLTRCPHIPLHHRVEKDSLVDRILVAVLIIIREFRKHGIRDDPRSIITSTGENVREQNLNLK